MITIRVISPIKATYILIKTKECKETIECFYSDPREKYKNFSLEERTPGQMKIALKARLKAVKQYNPESDIRKLAKLLPKNSQIFVHDDSQTFEPVLFTQPELNNYTI